MTNLIDRYGNVLSDHRADLVRQCMERMMQLDERERELILIWFCSHCGKYIAPGQPECRCKDER